MTRGTCGNTLSSRAKAPPHNSVLEDPDNVRGLKTPAKGSPEALLLACLNNIIMCRREAVEAAKMQRAVRLLNVAKANIAFSSSNGNIILTKVKKKTCALVGDSSLLRATRLPYGQFIDRHEVVLRIASLYRKGLSPMVLGTKTTHMLLNREASIPVCCAEPVGNSTNMESSEHDDSPVTYIVHNPAHQSKIVQRCRSWALAETQNEIVALSVMNMKRIVAIMKDLRKDIARLGLAVGDFRMLSEAALGVLMLLPMCETISLYGVPSFVKNQPKPVFSSSSNLMPLHDPLGEQLVWRLLHAAGHLNVCQM